jgi:ABC-type glycerol-3-phosphate transport system substrate-binding protein
MIMRNLRDPMLALAAAVLLTACAALQPGATPDEGRQPTPSPGDLTAMPEITPSATPGDAGGPGDEPGEVVLAVWAAGPHVPSADTPGGQELLAQLASFDETHPDIRVEVNVKAISGPGSTIAYLRSAPPVAPSILPDVALMDRDTLVQAFQEGLIVPVDSVLAPEDMPALYPVAVDLARVGDQVAGMPYVLQVQHVAYRQSLFTDPPGSYDRILNSPVPFVFPAGTLADVNRTTLAQYLAAGGRLVDDAGQPTLDPLVLAGVLQFYADARAAGIIDAALFQLTDPAESWQLYRERQAALASVLSTAYLAERDVLHNTGLTWIPTPDGEPFALATGWFWVITTRDEDRQAAAAALISFLMGPINQGSYTRAAGWLPANSGALVIWGDDDPYAEFADRLLLAAAPLPDPAIRAQAGAAIQDALEEVLLNNIQPISAANSAVQQVNPTSGSSP